MHSRALGKSISQLIVSWMAVFLWLMTQPIATLAQAVVGSMSKDQLFLGEGSGVPLPSGQWQLIQVFKTPSRMSGVWPPQNYEWSARVFKNADPDSNLPMLIVRSTDTPLKWGKTPCATDAANPNQFLVNMYTAQTGGLVDKCSRVFAFDHFASWIEKTAATNDYWKPAVDALSKLELNHGGVLYAQLRVQQFNGRAADISLFIRPPKGMDLRAFRKDGVANNLNANHQVLNQWLSIYVESMEQTFVYKKPTTMLALQLLAPAGAVVAAANSDGKSSVNPANPIAVEAPPLKKQTVPTPTLADPVKPVVEVDTSASKLPAVQVKPETAEAKPVTNTDSTQKLMAERQSLEQEKLALAQQMEKMREMLAQLQRANEAAVAQAAKKETATPEVQVSKTSQVFANRKALVIGNDQYIHVSRLNNAGTDAEAMAAALTSVGYKVSKYLNLDEKKFKQALRDFRQQVEGGDEVLIFYAGHGVQLANANFLLPTDIKGESEDQIKDESIQLQRILDDLQDKKAKFSLAVIDACRDNPFKGQGRALGGRGLAPTTAATGQMIIFSAGAGQQALDKLGEKDPEKNGVFTRIFIKEMVKPGVPVDRVLRNVRNEVVNLAKSVGHEQTPALYDQAIGEFYFKQ